MGKSSHYGYECFHCGHDTVVWDSDFDFSDFCLEGDGIVHCLHCANCGSEIFYQVPSSSNSDEDATEVIDD